MYSVIAALITAFVTVLTVTAFAQGSLESDVFKTTEGELKITFIGHGTLMFHFKGKTIHVDPWSNMADYSKLPKADMVFITHEHRDHLDPKALDVIRTEKTMVVLTETCAQQVQGGMVMKNGDTKLVDGFRVEAVPAYNLVHKRDTGQPFHPKGTGNGYVITFGDKRVYVAGDTEDIPEMGQLQGIDIAFLPMNAPPTMTPEMVARAAMVLKPKILYPYHYGKTDVSKLLVLMKDTKEIEVRIRKME